MVTEKDEQAIARRRLILRDSLGFLTLVVGTLALFGITLALFRSFSAHREDLAKRWSQRGDAALKSGHPEQAVVALRTALGYAPDTRDYELLLAEALGQAGRTDESYSYFMTLWDRQPGDGLINLELARLAARRGDRNAAVEFYRASIYGTWQGDGVIRRATVRLELARYLVASADYPAARMELLIAGGNVPESPEFDQTLAGLLVQAHDPADAWSFYQKALAARPKDPGLLQNAGQLAYQNGDYAWAARLLSRAETVRAEQHLPPEPGEARMAAESSRIAEIAPLPSLSVRLRGERVLALRRTARKRLQSCVTSRGTGNAAALTALQPVEAAWSTPQTAADLVELRSDTDQQDAAMQLVYATEIAAAKVCPPATGDDAILLILANRAQPQPTGNDNVAAQPAPKPSLIHRLNPADALTSKAGAVLKKIR